MADAATSSRPLPRRSSPTTRSPDRYRHWKLTVDGAIATLAMDVDEDGGLRPGYKLKLNSLRPRRRHRAARRAAAHALRAPARCAAVVVTSATDRMFCSGANIFMLGLLVARVEGELLQVHQRDAQRHRGREPPLRAQVHRGVQRHDRRRRLRARARVRRDPAGRRPHLGGEPARGPAARRAARHRRAHAPHRQAQGAARPRRRVLHAGRGRARAAREGVAPGRRPSRSRSSSPSSCAARVEALAARSDRPARTRTASR